MAALITSEIPAQSFEIIRNKIGEILKEELLQQYTITDNEALNTSVWNERIIPFDKEELPAVNVSLSEGVYDGQTIKQSDGNYTFNIDCETNSKANAEESGDVLAMLKCQKLVGVIRAILQNPKYKNLGFDSGFIMSKQVTKIQFGNKYGADSMGSCVGRLVIVIKAPETTELIEPELLGEHDTQVKLALTNRGYKWILEN